MIRFVEAFSAQDYRRSCDREDRRSLVKQDYAELEQRYLALNPRKRRAARRNVVAMKRAGY